MNRSIPRLGVCYYPEHWPQSQWPRDAERMAELGISVVRIGEFAWSRLELSRNQFSFDWLHQAMDTLHAAGLQIVVGTPTATPPKWLIDKLPDMLALDREGRPRGFGSRRHYCFSHEGYRKECARIVKKLAKEVGKHPGLVAWQTDNEYGCHDTTLSWSTGARDAFRRWLEVKYEEIENLNEAWGNVFWSMEYRTFDEIELPEQAVTETNPAHRMDFYRFSSDQVVAFNRLQVDILRTATPDIPVLHNFMGRTLEFDHFDVGADLDISTWDSYPLGFLEDRSDRDETFKAKYSKAGDVDMQAFHHDLYRATSRGRWWVMEQQPGPVNWAPHNPAPQTGQVRAWTWEAIGHGAEVVSYFRWRQAPFAQEQMHAGLLRPDDSPSPGFTEAASVADDLAILQEDERADGLFDNSPTAEVALVFDYPSAWAWKIQPQGKEFDYFRLVFDFYTGLRSLGLTVDIVPANEADYSRYKLVLVPGLFSFSKKLKEALRTADAQVVIGPRTGSKTADFSIPNTLPPGLTTEELDVKVTHVESLRSDCGISASAGAIQFWREHLEVGGNAEIQMVSDDALPVLVRQGNLHYLAGWPDAEMMIHLLKQVATVAAISTQELPEGVRLVRRGKFRFFVSYRAEPFDLSTLGISGIFILGGPSLPPAGIAIVRDAD